MIGGAVMAVSTSSISLGTSSVNGNIARLHGGAFYVDRSSLVASRSTINDNKATAHGGGLFVAASLFVHLVEGCSVDGNLAITGGGGGIYLTTSSVSAINSSISSNIAKTFGGGAFLQRSKLTASSSEIHLNTGGSTGGGVSASSLSTIMLSDGASVNENSAPYGGGAFLQQSTLTVKRSSINDNRAIDGGGVCAMTSSLLTIIDISWVDGNQADNNGAGVYAYSSSVNLTQSSISSNNAMTYGGGLMLNAGTLAVSNGSIDSNTVGVAGGGIGAFSSSFIILADGASTNGNYGTDGGGLFLQASSLTASRSSVNGNRATNDGGGVYVTGSSVLELREGSSVDSNIVDRNGAGICSFTSIVTVTQSSISSNNAGNRGGGLSVFESSLITLREGACADRNTAVNGGGLALQASSLTVSGSSIDGNRAKLDGGGVYAFGSSSCVFSFGATANSNTGNRYGGGVNLQQSTLTVSRSSINDNLSNLGGGVYGFGSSSIILTHGASVNVNMATDDGGGIYLGASLLVGSSASIYGNSAGYEGGGLYAKSSSSVTLDANTSIVCNVAISGQGGGICIRQSSTLTFRSHTSICNNSAPRGGGGGFLASASTVRLGSTGVLTLVNNTAAYGGAFALIETSSLIDSEDSSHGGQPTSRTYLTVRDNTAISSDGGGLSVSGDSTVNLGATVVILFRNTAAFRGGGLFVSVSPWQEEATELSNNTGCSITGRFAFWHLDLIENVALTGDGGGMFSASNINLRHGGLTNATGNTAIRGGAVALYDATLIVQSLHKFSAQHNLAEKDGGGIALFSGARLLLLEATSCPASCGSSASAGEQCDAACMSAECNWDGGICVAQKMERAGADALSPCDRDQCSSHFQTNAAASVDGCTPVCFTASCDWSRNLCVGPRENVLSCPLIDAAAFASIRAAQQEQMSTPVFLTGGNSQDGFGRCSSPCQQPEPPPDASSMLGAGVVGTGALHLVPADNNTQPNGWVGVAINTHNIPDELQVGFTVESWIQLPMACAGADRTFLFVIAGHDYALALRGSSASLSFVLLFFWTAAPSQQCVAGPQLLTAGTG